jgi:phage terminase large subunit GpA-like protein
MRSFGEWMQAEIVIPSGPVAGERLSFTRQPWVRLWAEAVDSGRYRSHVVTGYVQSGKSLNCFVAVVLYVLFELRENVIAGFPTGALANTKWNEDIYPAIMASSYAALMPTKGTGSQGGTPDLITFLNGVTLQLMTGGGSDKTRAGATARFVVVTETDGLDLVGGTSAEGTKISQLQGRTEAFADRGRHFFECTVSTDKAFTWREYQSGTASRIVCECPHCGVGVTPEREDLIGWQDAKSASEAGRLAAFVCSECGGLWTESQRREMNRTATLLHRGQQLTEGEITGEHPDTYTLGFRWNAFNNLLWPTSYIAEGEWKAAQGERGEEQLIANRTRDQYIWAQPVVEETVERVDITLGIVRGSATGYAGRCNGIARGVWPEDTLRRVGTVDVHRRNLRWQVMALRANGQFHVVDYGTYATRQPDVIGDEAAITEAIEEICPQLHETHEVDAGFVDCGHWVETVQDAVKACGSPWICSHGANKFKMPERTTAARIRNRHADRWYITKPKPGVRVVTMDPNYFKTVVHSTLVIKPIDDEGEVAPGSLTLFGSDPKEHHDWATEILAETFERTFSAGKGYVEKWHKHSRHNHSLDLTYGGLCALEYAETTVTNNAGKSFGELARQAREGRASPK